MLSIFPTLPRQRGPHLTRPGAGPPFQLFFDRTTVTQAAPPFAVFEGWEFYIPKNQGRLSAAVDFTES